jgi:outer membrane receptor protein involved in Fe transport
MNFCRLGFAISPVLLAASISAQQTAEVVEVVGQTPLGAGVDIDRIASNVQSATAEQMREQRALDLADFMRRNLASVFVNEAQSNPLQPDVQYRGFVGSPLLGLPQGIAVYQDGVRINEPFGDTVNWALIPDSAIDSVYLMPGSNPLFGLNALGGAISIDTKDGFANDGTRAEAYGGSFGRTRLQAETGGSSDDRFGWFVTGAWFEEDGWRDYSPTEALQLFGKLSWESEATSIDLGVSLADTDLIGNGAAPVELLELDRRAIFTRPDQTENELALINLVAEHRLSNTLSLTGNVYMRGSDISTYNGDDSDFEECEDNPGFICEEDDDEEELIFDRGGSPIQASDDVEGATVNRTSTRQDGIGFGVQATWTGALAGRENLLVLGMAYEDSDIEFDASTELGGLDSTRLAVPGGVFVGESFTALDAATSTTGIFFSNTFALAASIALSVSGRYNDTDVTLRDQLGTALDGDHTFSRFNPAIGITAGLGDDLTFYAGYSESNRAPSPVELTCADEDDPCRLPNAFLADPPLEQVVAKTFEAGFRGNWTRGSWHAGVFRTTNEDDILFISAGALTNEGYFDNVGRTRRDGIELDLNGDAGASVSWFVNYTYLDATFRVPIAFPSPNNPAAIDGEVSVAPGDRLPLIPQQLLKGGIRATLGERVTLGADLLAGGDFYMRGDEGNDGGRIGDYTVLNLRGAYRISDSLRVFLNIDNLLDKDYETFGVFGEPDEVLGDGFEDSRFFSPAAPRAAWLGVEVEF